MKRVESKERAESMYSEFSDSPKVKYSISLPADVLERLRDAAYWSRLPLAVIVERAVQAELERMKADNGGPFEARPEPLRSGRPVR